MNAHSGKAAIVTGASSGVGRASAEARFAPAEIFDKSLRKHMRLPV
jgi:NADP-dependent 3-hydroxy acid dehydrogenase YdfG